MICSVINVSGISTGYNKTWGQKFVSYLFQYSMYFQNKFPTKMSLQTYLNCVKKQNTELDDSKECLFIDMM